MEPLPKIEDFYGVYLLCSQSPEPKYRNKIYIGFTVNPNRRINQHNRGRDFGGAKKTSNKGPWKMVMIIHGFPNNISALQFEWAWQWPKVSSRLKHIPSLNRKRNETHFEYNFRILSEMLRIGPWNRLPLVIRWLAPDFVREFAPNKVPPLHMQICHGQVSIKKKFKVTDGEMLTTAATQSALPATTQESQVHALECHLCMQIIENAERSKITCMNPKCRLRCHIVCLANMCLVPGHYVPIEGNCPICEQHFLWGDLIRKKRGCNDLEESAFDESDDDDNFDYDADIDLITESQQSVVDDDDCDKHDDI